MTENTNKKLKDVVVYMDNDQGVTQPQSFQMCALGLQFYSDRKISEFDIMKFDLHVNDDPKDPGNVHCTGAVVKCQEVNDDDGKYRVWLKFIDTPEQTCDQLTCIARKGKHLCTFCENF